MVTFTCNNCGDSVKKNRVEKHYSMECRRKTGGPNVCCIDCLKDFRQDYDAHTSCQTEEERYSAKGTYVAKEAKNKQQKKQMTWSEIIQSVATSQNLSQSFKDILDIFKDNENVPRKEAKFKNFCKNNYHLRRFSEKDIMSVFALIQEEMKKNQEEMKKNQEAAKLEQQQALAAAKEKKNTEQQPEAKKRSISESNEDQDKEVQAKKLKTENTEAEVVESKKDKKKKKKKSKNNDIEMNDKENNEIPAIATTNGVKLTKAEKKKNKKAKETANVEMQDELIVNNGVQNGTSLDKKKKKKNKKKSLETENGVEEIKTNGTEETSGEILTNGSSKKKKKNKSKGNSESSQDIKIELDTTVDVDEDLNSSVNSNWTPKKKRKSTEPEKTPFKEIIAKLLKPGTEFKLKALKKMVFAVYKSGEEEVPREVRENFNKKLSKIPNVQVNEKIVKMVK